MGMLSKDEDAGDAMDAVGSRPGRGRLHTQDSVHSNPLNTRVDINWEVHLLLVI